MAELNDQLVAELEQLAPVDEALAARPDWSQVTQRLPTTTAPTGGMRWRVRPQRLLVVLCVLAASAVVAVAALAASGSWLWQGVPGGLQGSTQIRFHGDTYSLGLITQGRSFSLVLTRAERSEVPWFAVATASGADLPPRMLSDRPIGAVSYATGGGEIWFGDSAPSITAIEITDTHGHVFKAQTVAPPPLWQLAFRLWVIALPRSSATQIAGFDAHGELVQRSSTSNLQSAIWSD